MLLDSLVTDVTHDGTAWGSKSGMDPQSILVNLEQLDISDDGILPTGEIVIQRPTRLQFAHHT